MNRYDELYIFRKAKMEDLENLTRFIKENWRQNHILANDREFFLYEHGDGEDLNFVICEEKASGEIVGMHGYIPYSINKELSHVCGVMTMVKKDITLPMLGVELIKRFIGITKYKTYCGIGTNPKTMIPIAKNIFQRTVGKMEHYYQLNEKVEEYKIPIIINRNRSVINSRESVQADLIEINEFAELKKIFDFKKTYRFLPYKEDWYIEKRYFNHPIYHYRVWTIIIDGQVSALLVGREVRHGNSKIIRFVDFIGDINYLALTRKGIKEIIEIYRYEYADFLLHGVPENIMKEAGFIRKKDGDENIIPNYFEPFVQSNVDIWFETSHQDLIIFKADADADRPNMR